MEKHGYKINGVIRTSKTDRSRANLRIEAWDNDLLFDDFLGSATSDKDGCFSIVFDAAYFRELFLDRRPDLFFRVYEGNQLVLDTSGAVLWNIEMGQREVVLHLGAAPAEPTPPNPQTILEIHRHASATPAALEKTRPEIHRQLKARALESLKESLLAHFSGKSDALKPYLAKIDFTELATDGLGLKEFLLARWTGDGLPSSAEREGLKILSTYAGPEKIDDLLAPDKPIAENPVFSKDLRIASIHHLGKAAGLEPQVLQKLIEKDIAPENLSQAKLQSLVEEKILTQAKAEDLGFAANLYQWSAGNLELMAAAKTRLQDRQGKPVKELRDLAWAGMGRGDWLKFIDEAKVEPPQGLTKSAYAERLAKQIELLFPREAFRGRLRPVEAGDLTRLLENSPSEGYREAFRIANLHPGLELQSVLDDQNRSAREKAAEVSRRTDLVAKFFERNPSAPFLTMDLLPGGKEQEKLDFAGMEEPDQMRVTATLRAYQRAWRLAGKDSEHAMLLLEKGYDSAQKVLADSPKTFISSTGLPPAVAAEYYGRAKKNARDATVAHGIALERLRDPLRFTEVDNISGSVDAYLQRLPGYAEHFGNQAHCRCKHCQSIVSPAAYFVDLMEFIERNITRTTEGLPASGISLRARRADLWKLQLTCANTASLVPYLVIINEILENFVYLSGLPAGSTLPSSRAEIEDAVYARLSLADDVRSFRQPFMLPLERLGIYLAHFPVTRAEVVATVFRDAEDPAGILPRASLELSREQYALIGSPNPDAGDLAKLYGHAVPTVEENLQAFLAPLPIDRHELIRLLETRFIRGAGAVTIRAASLGGVQTDTEYIDGLTPALLDRLHRFVRLRGQLPWSAQELDIVIETLRPAGGAELPLADIGYLAGLQKKLKISAEDLCALAGLIPTRSVQAARPSLFDRLFNAAPFSRRPADAWTPAGGRPPSFLHPALRAPASGAAADPALPRLLAGLNIDDRSLLALIGHLGGALGTDAENRFPLSLANLSLLYRHARLMAAMKLKVADFLQLLGLAPTLAHPYLSDLSDLRQFLSFHDWWKESRYALDDLAYVTGGEVRDPGKYPRAESLMADLRLRAESERALVFADTVFTLLEGITEVQSRRIVAANHEGYFIPASLAADDSLALALPPEVLEDLGLADGVALRQAILHWIPSQQRPAAGAFLPGDLAEVAGLGFRNARLILAANPSTFVPVTPIFLRAGLQGHRIPAAADLSTLALPEAIASALETDAAARLRAALSERLQPYRNAGAPAFSGLIFTGISGLTAEQSRSIIASNPSLFETVTDDSRFFLAPGFASGTSIAIPAGTLLAPEQAHAHIRRFHVGAALPTLLAGQLQMSRENLASLFDLAGIDFEDDAVAGEWARLLQGEAAAGRLADLTTQLAAIARLKVLFADPIFTPKALDFIITEAGGNEALFPFFSPGETRALRAPSLEDVQVISRYRRFLPKEGGPAALHRSLTSGYAGAFPEAAIEDLAAVLGVERELVSELNRTLPLPGAAAPAPAGGNQALKALGKLADCAALASYLGTGGETLALIASDTYSDLDRAAGALFAAFRTKYADEKEWQSKIGPFEDRIREKKRDALSEHILHSLTPAGEPDDKFVRPDDLYHWFLIDTQLMGCARTSRVVAAISSLQLYVQRCLMNLERTGEGVFPAVSVSPADIPAQEWEWRKNYRLWEANRKVFLWPENYIEPDLRDDKTPLFRELEAGVLQQRIDAQTVLDAFGRYLDGFQDIARLSIAGSYHDQGGGRDILHLFGVTSSEPAVYYHRTIENVHLAETEQTAGVVWNPWRKLEVQIPVRQVSPMLFLGQLRLFWVEISTRPRNDTLNGTSRFQAYEHKRAMKFTSLRLDGNWTPPQAIQLNGRGMILDPLVHGNELLEFADHLLERLYPEASGREDRMNKVKDLYNQIHSAPDIEGGSETEDFLLQIASAFLQELRKVFKDAPTDVFEAAVSAELKGGDGSRTLTARLSRNRPAVANLLIPQLETASRQLHLESRDDYTLKGYQWDRAYPSPKSDGLYVAIGEGPDRWTTAKVDLHDLKLGSAVATDTAFSLSRESRLFMASAIGPGGLRSWGVSHGFTRTVSDFRPYTQAVNLARSTGGTLDGNTILLGSVPRIATLSPVNGSLADGILDVDADLFYLHAYPGYPIYILKRLGTTLAKNLGRTLFEKGIDGLLDPGTQEDLKEARPAFITHIEDIYNDARKGFDKIDFTGPMGVYFREIFFHIPFLIANHLNSQGRFADAQRWYHYIFDPTSDAIPEAGGVSGEEARRREKDRVWKYLEFRNHTLETLHARLNDMSAIESYSKDPFNPHALARLWLGSYKKAVFMKYVDNLLDWGDQLFSQDTMESVNEATLLYVMAADLLGKRPPELGDCHSESDTDLAYEALVGRMGRCPISSTAENLGMAHSRKPEDAHETGDGSSIIDSNLLDWAVKEAARRIPGPAWSGPDLDLGSGGGSPLPTIEADISSDDIYYRGSDWKLPGAFRYDGLIASFGTSLRRQACVFCVPFNKDLLAYWDRVEDRLGKIRNCRNISGLRRQLPLFAPEIDPRLLVRARAAGLNMEEVLNTTAGSLPPYRFSFLIIKAKEFAGALQGFGAALAGALEKKEVEELANLRLVHQDTILKLSSKLRDQEVAASEAGLDGLHKRKDGLLYRKDYYSALLENGGLSDLEIAHLTSKYVGLAILPTSALFTGLAAVLHLVPKIVGTSTSTGGEESAKSLEKFAGLTQAVAQFHGQVGEIIGSHAGYERRSEGWQHQVGLADKELAEIEKHIEAAEIRRDIAIASRDLHAKTLEQHQETFEFYKDKFSNLGLYTWLSGELQTLYREAYRNALTMARLAERAYRFERGDDATPLLAGGYWQAERAGLLAGERLMNDLRAMETRFMETHERGMEIDQAFSLVQIDPAALLKLKATGECEFTIPELYFDLSYPGQYRRRVKSARLTIPSVAGPFTNVSATLSLLGSQLRKDPVLGDAALLDVPPSRSLTIATSTAQGDSGVFRLDFRDERYMPFEGAGAVNSRWKLGLPKNFRLFDYATINDVILHISYTAEYGEEFREQVEGRNRQLETLLSGADFSLPRIFSLRQEFSQSFHHLLHRRAGESIPLRLGDKHFPLFLQGRELEITSARLVLEIDPERMRNGAGDVLPSDLQVTITGNAVGTDGRRAEASVSSFATDTLLGMPAATIHQADGASPIFQAFRPADGGLDLNLRVDNAGNFIPAAPAPSDPSALDDRKLKDAYLFLEYRVAAQG